jgi:hypothetical protein
MLDKIAKFIFSSLAVVRLTSSAFRGRMRRLEVYNDRG